MTVWICQEIFFSISRVSIYYAPVSDIQVISYDHLNYSRASVVHFRASRYIMGLNQLSMWKVMVVWIWSELLCSISSVSIYYALESDIQVKSYDHLNFSRASVVQFWASGNIMGLNHIVKSYGHLNLPRAFMFNFKCLNILRARIRDSIEMLWPFELLEMFHCSFSRNSKSIRT